VRLLPKINVARCVCVCAFLHMCVCVCVLSFVSSQLNLANLPPLSALLHFLLSLSPSLSLSLSPMNRLNFLMSCFYGLLMLIHSSPYALSLHSTVSRCLPRLIHPFSPPPPPHTLVSPAFLQQCLYLQAVQCTHVHSFLYNVRMCVPIT